MNNFCLTSLHSDMLITLQPIISESFDAYKLRHGSETSALFLSSVFQHLPTDSKANLADDIRKFYPVTELQ